MDLTCFSLMVLTGSGLAAPEKPGQHQPKSHNIHTNERRHQDAKARRRQHMEICVPVALGRSVYLLIATNVGGRHCYSCFTDVNMEV